MGTQGFVLAYVHSCTTGTLATGECGPVWHLLVIAVLLLAAITTLIVLRLRPGQQPARG